MDMAFGNNCTAGIVTYNPDLALLERCIISIVSQVEHLVVIDNGSQNIQSVKGLIKKIGQNIDITPLEKNQGIAYALNLIGKYAVEKQSDWFITLDQDSVCPSGMLERFNQYVGMDEVGMICPFIKQRIQKNNLLHNSSKYEFIQIAITSGSMVRIEAWKDVHGFWNDLFIDRVDDDFCLALKDNGWRILQTFEVSLEHEIGHPKKHQLISMEYYTDSYPDFRYYYIGRNTVVVCKYYKQLPYNMHRLLIRRFAKLLFGEDKKIPKLRAFITGVIDGYRWYHKGINRN